MTKGNDLLKEAMPRVVFVTDKLTVEVTKGSRIPDIVDACGATLPFGCRMGTCGTCRCIVIDGMENLNPKTENEELMFEHFTHVAKGERLGCQLIVNGDVTIRS